MAAAVQPYSPGGANEHHHPIMLPWTYLSPHRKWHLNRFSHFAHCTTESLYFTMGGHFSPSKLPLCTGVSGPTSTTWFLQPTWLNNPNSILISSGIFARLTIMRDRQTDHTIPSVTIGRIYVVLRCSLMIKAPWGPEMRRNCIITSSNRRAFDQFLRLWLVLSWLTRCM